MITWKNTDRPNGTTLRYYEGHNEVASQVEEILVINDGLVVKNITKGDTIMPPEEVAWRLEERIKEKKEDAIRRGQRNRGVRDDSGERADSY